MTRLDVQDEPSLDGGVRATPHWRQLLDAARVDVQLDRVLDLIRICESVICQAGLSGFNSMGTPRKDARAIVFETLSIRDHSDAYLNARVTGAERTAIMELLDQRVSGPTPVPYLLGEAFFAGLRFTIRPGVFIPRSALGLLLDEVLAAVTWSPAPRVLELGCGSGALGISVALRQPRAAVDLTDIDPLAVRLAEENVLRHGVGTRVVAAVSDLYADVAPDARYDLVLANLPYVPFGWRTPGELDAEPDAAIYRAGDGLDLVRSVIAGSHKHLAPDGALVIEVGAQQQPVVAALLGGRGRWSTVSGRSVGVVTLSRPELASMPDEGSP